MNSGRQGMAGDHRSRLVVAVEGRGRQHALQKAGHAAACVGHALASKIYSRVCVSHASARGGWMETRLVGAGRGETQDHGGMKRLTE